MNKNKEKFIKEWAEKYTKVGEFKNEYGELYILVECPFLKDGYIIAGDETDWEIYEYYPMLNLMCKTFGLNEVERKGLKKLTKDFEEKKK